MAEGTKVSSDGSFQFLTPVCFFEKAGAPEGEERRIAGLVSTESRDREDEVILQRGLDFSEFMSSGWYNDNHGKATTDILGYPDDVKFVRKGEQLPNGTTAPADGHWAEGHLLRGHPKADAIWQLGQSLQKTPGRRLGFSIEGRILKRAGDGKVIAKAKVRNVAITHCPVNTDTRLDVLAKSLRGAESSHGAYSDPDAPLDSAEEQARIALGAAADAADDVKIDGVLEMDLSDGQPAPRVNMTGKALTAGAATSNAKPIGPRSGAGAGRVLMPQSLERDEKEEGVRKSRLFTRSEAMAHVQAKFPNLSCATAGRVVDVTLALKRRGLI